MYTLKSEVMGLIRELSNCKGYELLNFKTYDEEKDTDVLNYLHQMGCMGRMRIINNLLCFVKDTDTCVITVFVCDDGIKLDCNSEEMFSFIPVKNIDLSNVDFSDVKQMNDMFSECTELESVDFGDNVNTHNLVTIDSMFNNCKKLKKVDLSKFDLHNVKYMDYMFYGCTELESVTFGENKEMKELVDVQSMFEGCKSLEEVDLSKLDFSTVENIDNMFKGCSIKFKANEIV